MGRRRWLKLGLTGGALLGLGGLLGWHTTGYEIPPERRRRLRSLSPKELLVIEAIARRLLRAGGGAPGADEVGAPLFIDRMASGMSPTARRDFGRLLHLVEHLRPPLSGHVSRFTRLSGPEQDEVLSAMRRSSSGLMRGAFDSLKSLCLMAYYRHPASWSEIGYDGPLIGRPAGGWRAAGLDGDGEG